MMVACGIIMHGDSDVMMEQILNWQIKLGKKKLKD
jgi:hypothetical protein